MAAFGSNSHGELGDGSTTDRSRPTTVDGLRDVSSVAAGGSVKFGDHSLAVTADGSVYAWGDNTNGELGDGTTTDRHTPVKVKLPNGATPRWLAVRFTAWR